MLTPVPPAEPEAALRSVHTSNLPALFARLGISLLVSTYQAGKLIVVRADGGGLNTHFRTLAKPMGLAVDGTRLSVGGASTVWEYRNVPAVVRTLDPPDRHDACYVPRRLHVTGDIDGHELAYGPDHELWVVNTRFSCLCTLEADYSFHPRWRPPFVSALAPEDRCHLNGLGMVDGRPTYVTALGSTDAGGGWRPHKATGGVLMDVESSEILLQGLSMPHSPRWYQGQLWFLESGQGTLARVDLTRERWETVAALPGFTRGLDFAGSLAFVGLSQVRESAVFSGIPLVARCPERSCGVWVVHLENGETVGFLRFEAGVQEIFAVQVLPGLRWPEVLAWEDARLAHTYVLPDAALAEVARPTAEELARSPGWHFQRGRSYQRAGQLPEAVAAYRSCVALEPTFPRARYHLGVALGDAGAYEEAVSWLQEVLEAEPEQAEAANSLGYCYSRLGQPAQAVAAFEQAVTLKPHDARAHVNLGLTLLHLGDYPRGFAEYEWRGQTGPGLAVQGAPPRWDGRSLPDKTLLIYTEQSSSETLLGARYLPLAAQRCGRLILACPDALRPLLAMVPGMHQICEPGAISVQEFDVSLPLLSLPHVFGTTRATIPAAVPYLDVAALRRRTDPAALPRLVPSAGPRVGVVCVGRPTAMPDGPHVWTLEDWAPVLQTPGITWVRLPRGDQPQALAPQPPDLPMQDLAPGQHDWGALALGLDQLDLILTGDTAVAHLAGALGQPAWVLLDDAPAWCWGLDGEHTPWYPTLRLFRPARAGDGVELMQRVAQALAAWRETAWRGGHRGIG
jgi:uncharacterized protein (TIGR03032 family)